MTFAVTEPAPAVDADADADDLHLVCTVGDAAYALPARRVIELETYPGATPVPGVRPWVAGLVQVRGRVIPAIDLRARFGLPAAVRTLDTRAVLVELEQRVVALVVDAAREVVRLPPELRRPAGAGDHGDHIGGVAELAHRRFLLVDLESLLGTGVSHGDRDEDHR